MRDVSIEDLADEIWQELAEQGCEVSRTSVRNLTRHFFSTVENLIQKEPDSRFSMYGRDITHIVYPMDKKKLCEEFAAGKGVSYQRLLETNTLSRNARHFLRFKGKNSMDDKDLK